jgi:hypothetical protein
MDSRDPLQSIEVHFVSFCNMPDDRSTLNMMCGNVPLSSEEVTAFVYCHGVVETQI